MPCIEPRTSLPSAPTASCSCASSPCADRHSAAAARTSPGSDPSASRLACRASRPLRSTPASSAAALRPASASCAVLCGGRGDGRVHLECCSGPLSEIYLQYCVCAVAWGLGATHTNRSVHDQHSTAASCGPREAGRASADRSTHLDLRRHRQQGGVELCHVRCALPVCGRAVAAALLLSMGWCVLVQAPRLAAHWPPPGCSQGPPSRCAGWARWLGGIASSGCTITSPT